MVDIHTSPFLIEELCNESAVTFIWFVFAAKKTSIFDNFFWNCLFDFSLFHQIEKLLFIDLPTSSVLSILIEQLLCRCEERQMHVFDTTNPFEEKFQILFLCETR